MEKASFALFLAALILSPLIFGAVHVYAYTFSFFCILSGTVLLLGSSIEREGKNEKYRLKILKSDLIPLFLLLLLFMIFQTITLPDSILQAISPGAWVVGKKSIPASIISDLKSASTWHSASAPYIYPVRQSINRLVLYWFLYMGLSMTINSRKRIHLVVLSLLLLGFFEAIYGIAETYSKSNQIWWFSKRVYVNDVTGTYINRNHFAGFMEIILLLTAGFAGAVSVHGKKTEEASQREKEVQ